MRFRLQRELDPESGRYIYNQRDSLPHPDNSLYRPTDQRYYYREGTSPCKEKLVFCAVRLTATRLLGFGRRLLSGDLCALGGAGGFEAGVVDITLTDTGEVETYMNVRGCLVGLAGGKSVTYRTTRGSRRWCRSLGVGG